MNTKTPNSANDSSRCQQRTATGRRCRLHVLDAPSRLCFRHAHLQQQKRDAADLAADLVGELVRFQSASDINECYERCLTSRGWEYNRLTQVAHRATKEGRCKS